MNRILSMLTAMFDNSYFWGAFAVFCLFLLWKWAKYWGYTFSEVILYGYCVITNMVLLQGIIGGTLRVPNGTILTAEIVFATLWLIAYVFIKRRLRYVSSLKEYEESDIKIRRRLKIGNTFMVATLLCLLPVLTASWGADTLPTLDYEDVSERQGVIEKFINMSLLISIGMTISAIFADTFINRITSEIYHYKDVKDIDQFCLYLRSFHDDNSYDESLLCKTFQKMLPVFAIGDPCKVLQPNGANRIYVTNDLWREAVSTLSEKTWLLLLRIGMTDGTKWEVLNVFQTDIVNKVIFIVYSGADYQYLANIVLEKMNVVIPELDIVDGKPMAFFIVQEGSGSYTVVHKQINKNQYVEELLKVYLNCHPELEREILLRSADRKQVWRKMWCNGNLPRDVRHSLNWGSLSPIVNMLHWPAWTWLLFFMGWGLCFALNSYIPVCLFFVFTLLFGNRIAWLSGNWNSVRLFLRHQRYEASIIWYTSILGLLSSVAYIFAYYLG